MTDQAQQVYFHAHKERKELKKPQTEIRWTTEEALALFDKPLMDLLFEAQTIHRQHFDPNKVQFSTLLSIKTGGCSEDCGYCPQSARYHTGVDNQDMLPIETVLDAAQRAKEQGATRFCMGAAWRRPKQRDLDKVIEMVQGVKNLGLETCVTLGMLQADQAKQLADAGLDYYNHNLDTSPEFYGDIISTRDYDDRLDTLASVRDAGIHVCSGGIIGLGENLKHRAELLVELANMNPAPESVPINQLVKVEGTPLAEKDDVAEVDPFEFIRTIAVARILMPSSFVRLSAGRQQMPETMQAMCFFAGANSIFYGEQLLTTPNPEANHDMALIKKLGMSPYTNYMNVGDECSTSSSETKESGCCSHSH